MPWRTFAEYINVYTVQEAMAERPDRQTNYTEALYGVYDYLKGVEMRIASILDNI